jgi:acetylornithine deacetylase/succinyl-diaminopimelate desuccinylase-like protein
MKNHYGHQHLQKLIHLHDERKIKYIMSFLKKLGVRYWYDKYKTGMNIYALIEGEDTGNTIAFMGHTDVVHPEYHNAQDNTASVSNLLHLVQILNKTELPRNVLICLTDEEESGGGGSRRVGNLINSKKYPYRLYC